MLSPGIVEPQIMIPSPVPNTSHNFFAPISPALSQSSGYALPQTLPSSTSKDIMEMLQSANSSSEVNGRAPKGINSYGNVIKIIYSLSI